MLNKQGRLSPRLLLIIHHRKPQRRQRKPRRERKRARREDTWRACAASCLKFKSTLFQRAGHRSSSRRQDKVSGGDTAGRPAASRRTVTATATPRRSMRRRLQLHDDDAAVRVDGRGGDGCGGTSPEEERDRAADRQRSEHATAAASRHASHPSSVCVSQSPYRCSLTAACSLSSVSHTTAMSSAPRPIPSSTTAAKCQAEMQQALDTKREREHKRERC